MALTGAVCRFGGILMPYISNEFFVLGSSGPLLVYAIVAMISCVTAFTIKHDTRNLKLDTYHALGETPQIENK